MPPFKSLLKTTCSAFLARTFWPGHFQGRVPEKPVFPGRGHQFAARTHFVRAVRAFQQRKRPFKQGRSRPAHAPLKRSFLFS
nr:MAG TPA: hypothetical protein [Caudoviricetes sp.]